MTEKGNKKEGGASLSHSKILIRKTTLFFMCTLNIQKGRVSSLIMESWCAIRWKENRATLSINNFFVNLFHSHVSDWSLQHISKHDFCHRFGQGCVVLALSICRLMKCSFIHGLGNYLSSVLLFLFVLFCHIWSCVWLYILAQASIICGDTRLVMCIHKLVELALCWAFQTMLSCVHFFWFVFEVVPSS